MIAHDRKIIFIHIPKCGGTSIETMLWPGKLLNRRPELLLGSAEGTPYAAHSALGPLQHLPARLIRDEMGADKFGQYYSFAIARHPVTRIVSQYRNMPMYPALRESIGMEENASFDRYLDCISRHRHFHWMPQYQFVLDVDDRVLVDDIFRLEDLTRHFSPLARRLGVQASNMRWRNLGRDEPPAITDGQRERVEAIYARDFKQFEYEPGPAGYARAHRATTPPARIRKRKWSPERA